MKKGKEKYSVSELEKMLLDKKVALSETFNQFTRRIRSNKVQIDLDALSANSWENLEERYLELLPAIEDMEQFLSMHKNKKDIYLLIDDSGSMNGTPFNSSLQSAFIIYAASQRNPNVNVFAYTWGKEGGLEDIITNNISASVSEISDGLQGAKNNFGKHGDAFLAPAINELSDIVASHGNSSSIKSVIIYSDGDLHDKNEALDQLEALSDLHSNLCIDTIIMHPHHTLGNSNNMTDCILNSSVRRSGVFKENVIKDTIGFGTIDKNFNSRTSLKVPEYFIGK